MLDKLVKLEIVPKYIDSLEYWLEELQEYDEYYELNPMLRYLQLKNDSYIEYTMHLNKSTNVHMEAAKNLLSNREVIRARYRNYSNSISETFVQTVPYAMLEIFKLCSRLFQFENSVECSMMRNMTMSDEGYITENNTRVILSQDRPSNMSIISDDQVERFWTQVDSMAENKGSYSHQVLCGSWKAADNEDLLSRHILLLYSDDFVKASSENGTFRELCKSCSSLCGPTSQVYLDWFVESIKLDPVADLIYTSGLLISVVFLMMTLAVFCLIPRLHRPLHGKCTVFHLISMVTAYISLSLPQLAPDLHKQRPTYCLINGYVVQYGFLAMFFWLNVLCFDILYAFSFPTERRNERKNGGGDRKKLLYYSFYGCGGPLLMMSITIIMEYSHLLSTDDVFKPNIGGPKCFFQNVNAQWLYLYGPIGCLILANLIMFTVTAFNIYKHCKDTEMLQSCDNTAFNKANNNRLKVFMNLFILMGANWMAELLSWLLPNRQIIKYLLDGTTALQGLLVFLLLICNRRVLTELGNRLQGLYTSRRHPKPYQSSISSAKSSGQTLTTNLPLTP